MGKPVTDDHRHHTRRHVLKAAIAGAAGMVLGAPARYAFAQTASQPPNVQRLSDELLVVTIPGEANVVAHVVSGGDGVVLVDGASAKASDAVMNAIASLPGGG